MVVDLRDLEPAPSLPGADGEGRRTRGRWWVGRLGSYGVTLFFLITLNFFLPRAMPGNPLLGLVADPHSPTFVANPAIRSALAHYYGLDQSLWSQYAHYLAGLAQGNLGVSITSNTPVTTLLAGRLPWTLLLVGSGLLLASVVAMVGGVHSGWRPGGSADRRLLGVFLVLGYGPVIFLTPVALYLLAVKVHLFPLGGGSTPFATFGLAGQVADVGHHLVLPGIVMAMLFVGSQYLLMRGGMVSELGADYLRLGRAKGLRDRRLKYRHAARNALLPVVSEQAAQLGFAVGISLVVERLFTWPGVGSFMFAAVQARDYPTMQGCFLVISVTVVTANLLADLAYARLDPRTRV